MRCNECRALTCLRHQIPWHDGMPCEEYDEHLRLDGKRNEGNEASAALIATITKNCPGCQVPIYKYTGCDHFTCESLIPNPFHCQALPLYPTTGTTRNLTKIAGNQCHHEFCWQCLVPYDNVRAEEGEGWRGHRAICPYHDPTMPSYAPMNPTRYLEGRLPDNGYEDEDDEEILVESE
jgi:hypothetical protein